MSLNPENLREKGDFSFPGASQLSEERLVSGLIAKEERAYRELIERWSEKLYRIAFRYLRRKEEAQEVVQDVFQKVVEKIHTFKGDSSLSTWLFRVTVNEALMRIRSGKGVKNISWEAILPKFEDGIWTETSPDWSKLPDEKLLEKESKHFVTQAIEDLPEDYRSAYLLKDLEQLSEDEVCEALDLTKAVMKMRVHRARLFLKKKLEQKY